MEAVTGRGGNEEAMTAGVQPETDRGENEAERGGRATAETGKEKETKAKSEGSRVKTERKAGAEDAETEGGGAPVHLSHLTARGQIVWPMHRTKRRKRKNRRR